MRVLGALALMAVLGTALGQSRPEPADVLGDVAADLVRLSPETADALIRIHDYLQNESPLEQRRFTLAALIAARELNLGRVWSLHARAASRVGLERAVVDTVRDSAPSTGLGAEDALLIDFGRQLYRERHVHSATFATLVERLGRQATFDAIMALTYPAMIGLLHRAVGDGPTAGTSADAGLPVRSDVGTPLGRPGAFVALGPRPPLPADVHEDSYYRFPLLMRDALDARGREIFDALVPAGQERAPRGPVGMTLNSPELALPVQQINTALRVEGALDTRMSEIVITATGREMNSQYQWIVHGAAAAQAGAEARVLDAIRDDGDLAGLDERDAVAIAFTRELFRDEVVSEQTFAAAEDHFGRRGALEIAALAGDYLMMTTVYNALGMRLRPDQEPTLPHRAGAPVGAEWR